MFWDVARITVKAGDGGDGATSFLHEKYRAKGGPDGGDGGKGGDIVFVSDKGLNTLSWFRTRRLVLAPSGAPGGKNKKHGKSGEDVVVKVPLGTVIRRSDQADSPIDLSEHDQQVTVAEGGAGGFGNAHFTSSVRQTPMVAELGEKGDEYELTLELKLVADVGLVGLPNAGKSSLLNRITAANPEIADYPFTTKIPQLGVVEMGPIHFVICDIPGLIEGAHQGKGLGDEFLRHVERTRVLVHLVDGTSEDVEGELAQVEHELSSYNPDLLQKPRILVLNKIDLPHAANIKARFLKAHKGAMAMSAASGEGVDDLIRKIAELLSKTEVAEPIVAPKARKRITIADAPELFEVTKTEQGYTVTGPKIERFARRLRLSDPHAQLRLRDIMRRMGVTRQLKRHGAADGDKVQIGVQTIEFRDK